MFFKKKEQKNDNKKMELKAFVSGKVIPIEQVEDEVFSSKALGDGLAIEPESGVICAPCDAVVSVLNDDMKHAVGLTLGNGAQILIHEGIDTVNLQGEGFQVYVKEGEHVKTGQKLLQFDAGLIQEKGYKKTCILVLTETEGISHINCISGMDAIQGETVIIEMEK